MTELFDNIPESKSPKLLWMEQHEVSVRRNENMGEDEFPFEAWKGELSIAVECVARNGHTTISMGFGATEHDAIVALAEKNGWKLWNEE